MIRIRKWAGAIVGILALTTSVAYGAMASGTYSVEFDGSASLWDVSGTYDASFDPIEINYTLSMDPSGKFTGEGSASISGYEDGYYVDLHADFTFVGSVKSAGNVVRVNMSMKMTGSGEVAGYYATFAASIKEALEVDASTRQLVGTLSGKVSVAIPGQGKASQAIPQTDYAVSLPPDMSGIWELDLDVVPADTKYIGSGEVRLSNGTSFGFTLGGTYSVKTDLTKLTLKGIPPYSNLNVSLAATNVTSELNIQTLKGKLLGQKIAVTGY